MWEQWNGSFLPKIYVYEKGRLKTTITSVIWCLVVYFFTKVGAGGHYFRLKN